MNNNYLYAIVALLFSIAVGLMTYKANALNFPLTSSQSNTLWQIETQIRFNAQGGSQTVNMWLPKETDSFIVNDEDFFSGEFGLSIAKINKQKKAVWTIREANGWQTLFYRALLEPVNSDLGSVDYDVPTIEKPIFSEIQLDIANSIIDKTKSSSANSESFVLQLMTVMSQRYSMDNLSVLVPSGFESRMPLLVRLLALENLPARQANGFLLAEGTNGNIKNWLQVYYNGSWHLFDQGTRQKISSDEALVMWYGFDEFITIKGAKEVNVKSVVEPKDENLLDFFQLMKNEASHWLIDYSFFSLPLTIQKDFRILVTIPIGVLLLVLLRNLIGIKTFGTFLPILVALSFRDTGLLSGIILFTIVVMLGLLTRIFLDRLALLMIPRVGSILIVVLLFMITISLLSYKLGINIGLSVTLFPMVILAIMIERMSILWDERGPLEVLVQGIGTICVATLAYYLMNYDPLQHIMFVFPELLLVVLSITMLMGRYTGFKLTELFRFRAFVDSATTKRD